MQRYGIISNHPNVSAKKTLFSAFFSVFDAFHDTFGNFAFHKKPYFLTCTLVWRKWPLEVIDGATMRAAAFVLHRRAAMSATIAHAVMLEMLVKGKDLISDEQHIA